MKQRLWLASALALFLAPRLAFAGGSQVTQIPTLGELGLVVVAVGLVGSGIALLRRRR